MQQQVHFLVETEPIIYTSNSHSRYPELYKYFILQLETISSHLHGSCQNLTKFMCLPVVAYHMQS